jgi:hypothetical protein
MTPISDRQALRRPGTLQQRLLDARLRRRPAEQNDRVAGFEPTGSIRRNGTTREARHRMRRRVTVYFGR